MNIFEQAEFHLIIYMFCTTLDSEMKHLNNAGQYIHKRQAEPITVEDENLLLETCNWLIRYYLTNCSATYICIIIWLGYILLYEVAVSIDSSCICLLRYN